MVHEMNGQTEEDDANEEAEPIISAFRYLSSAHYHEIISIIDKIPEFSSSSNDDSINIELELNLERYQQLLDLYQEQPHLLDSALDEFISKLVLQIRHCLSENDDHHPPLSSFGNVCFVFLAHLAKVRGRKVVSRSLPHDVADFIPILRILEKSVADVDDRHFSVDARQMLLLWLSILCKNPFELRRFDPAGNLVERIIAVCRHYLHRMPEKTQQASALLLAQLLTRPDVREMHLENAVKFELSLLKGTHKLSSLLFLALIFKEGDRAILLHIAKVTLAEVTPRKSAESCEETDSLVRKALIKLVQRIGLVFLKPKVVEWRYRRGNRSLMINLGMKDEGREKRAKLENNGRENEENDQNSEENGRTMEENVSKMNENEQKFEETEQNFKEYSSNDCKDDHSTSIDFDEQLETVLQMLLTGLKDRDTIVRWSAAKGIGRVCGRLVANKVDDVLETVLRMCLQRGDGVSIWHGGCLTLAELARRGCLSSRRLAQVVDFLQQALLFDQLRGRHSVGTSVRDAACYLCWSLARAFDDQQIRPFAMSIAPSLLAVALFDREINVRRAASAAFQENVGRHGAFPHGIDIVTVVDYFAVGQRIRCYRHLCLFVAGFSEYTRSLIDHLVEYKLGHWDQRIRLLASQSLQSLTTFDPVYVSNRVLPPLLNRCDNANSFCKQGCLFAVGHTVAGLVHCQMQSHLCRNIVAEVGRLPGNIVGGGGGGGDLLKIGQNVLIGCLSRANFPVDAEQLSVWHRTIGTNLKDVNVDVQTGAAEAMRFLWRHCSDGQEGFLDEKIADFERMFIVANNESERIGASLALGSVPAELALTMCENVRTSDRLLQTLTTVKSRRDATWVLARRQALLAVEQLVETVGVNNVADLDGIFDGYLSSALDDYTTDSRGDVGRMLREVAMLTLAHLLALRWANGWTDQSKVVQIVCKILQQACEKIDSTRKTAATVMCKLLYDCSIPLPSRDLLLKVFPPLDEIDWNTIDSFKRLSLLLTCRHYLYHALLGFVISAVKWIDYLIAIRMRSFPCGVTESTMKAASEALLSLMVSMSDDIDRMADFLRVLADIFVDFSHSDRVVVPLLRVFDRILARGLFVGFESAPDSCAHLVRLVQSTLTQGATKCNTVKLKIVLAVLCEMLQFNSNSKIWAKSVSFVVQTLCHKYPVVRRSAAEQLYESLLTYGSLDNHTEVVLSILSEIRWDSDDMDELMTIRDDIGSRLGVF